MVDLCTEGEHSIAGAGSAVPVHDRSDSRPSDSTAPTAQASPVSGSTRSLDTVNEPLPLRVHQDSQSPSAATAPVAAHSVSSTAVLPSAGPPTQSPSSQPAAAQVTVGVPLGVPAAVDTATPPTPAGAAAPTVPARVRTLSTLELKDTFKRALEFVRPFLQVSAVELSAKPDGSAPPALVLGDAEKLKFYGYFKQATKGDQPSGTAKATDAVEAAKVEAWAAVRGLSRRDAMRAFVFLLYQVLPTWESLL